MKDPIIHEAALEGLLHSPSGAIARELERVAEFVVQESKDALLLVKADPGHRKPHSVEEIAGVRQHTIPHWRSGDLADKVRAEPAEVDNQGLVVFVITDPDHGHGIYSIELLDAGYRFLPERPYYHYDPITSSE